MTRILLLRHAAGPHVGSVLAGRQPGHGLSDEGTRQVERLVAALRDVRFAAIHTSPTVRAVDTARPIATATGSPVLLEPAFEEIDFGDWTGRRIADLDGEGSEQWRRFNAFRSGTRIPGGELMLEAQARAVAAMTQLAELHDGALVLCVSHADIIKAVVAHYLGMPLDLAPHRLQVDCASATALMLDRWGARLAALNLADARAAVAALG